MTKKIDKKAGSRNFILTATPGKTNAELLAEAELIPELNGSFVVTAFSLVGETDLTAVVDAMRQISSRVKRDDLSDIENMLVCQAAALQTIFTSLANRASGQEKLSQYQTFLTLALKAQSQSRSTIQALVELKFPRQVSFVKQANIANGPQQVNNDTQPERIESRAQENDAIQNKLSPQIEDTRHERETLEFTGTAAAGGTDSAMETVEKIHRAQKRTR
jgi:hypothetical protein